MVLPVEAAAELGTRYVRPKTSSWAGRAASGSVRHAQRTTALARLKDQVVPSAKGLSAAHVANGLCIVRDSLQVHADALACLGMPVAQIHAALASESAQRAIDGIAVAEEQIAWADGAAAGIDYRTFADWL